MTLQFCKPVRNFEIVQEVIQPIKVQACPEPQTVR